MFNFHVKNKLSIDDIFRVNDVSQRCALYNSLLLSFYTGEYIPAQVIVTHKVHCI